MSLENLIPLFGPADFTHKVDWSLDPFDDSIFDSGTLFRPSNSTFDYGGGFSVSLRTEGRRIRLERAHEGSADLNFQLNSPLLLAANPDDIDSADNAAIRIALSPGVRGVGAYVSGTRNGVSTQTQQDVFIAEMWVRLAGSDEALPCTNVGRNGSTLAENQEPTAPFVGVESTAADIVEVCFDVSLFGKKRFDFVAISDLWLIRA